MIFNEHSTLAEQHAFLSPSTYHWINYDDDKLEQRWKTARAAVRGVLLHAWAAESIKLRRKQPNTKDSVNQYVNDCIKFNMVPEQVLFYSVNAFGTADAISFENGVLRISDLKTGVTKASFQQLEVYAAYFCLEYDIKPHMIEIELRIYQKKEVHLHIADPDRIAQIMETVVRFDERIEALKREDRR